MTGQKRWGQQLTTTLGLLGLRTDRVVSRQNLLGYPTTVHREVAKVFAQTFEGPQLLLQTSCEGLATLVGKLQPLGTQPESPNQKLNPNPNS